MIVRIEAAFRKFWRVFNPQDWMARLLNLPKIKNASQAPGLVMIQVDGLSLTQLKRAIQKRNMPFCARLLKKESYEIYRHYSGVPSNTPAVQGALFYGVKSCVPAFSYKDSQTGELFNMFSPASAAAVENRLKDQREPLLKDGSAYGNIFTGGAKEAHFCASSVGWGSLWTAANPLAGPLTMLLNFHIFFRALFLVFLEFILAVVDSIRGILSGKKLLSEMNYVAMRVAVCIVLREVIATGVRIDIARGLPVIHMNLAGYDEQAHHQGPKSAFAHWSLRGIDSAIAKVWKAAQRSDVRHYDVFIYSDHGQEETSNYQEEYGRPAQEAVHQVLKEVSASRKWSTQFNSHSHHWRSHLLRNSPLKKSESESVENKELSSRSIITSLGSVGHVYLPEAIPIEEKEVICLQLVAQAKIPIVMIPDGPEHALVWNADGKFRFPEDAEKVLETSHPFFKEVVRDLVELCHHPDSGELVILGWRKGFKSLTFCDEQGSHAGPGPEETSAFAMLPMGTFFGKETLYTQDLRDAAFRAQERGDASPKNGVSLASPPSLRIMTYNVHGCMGRDGKISPSRIAGIIARHRPDLIALQELKSNEQVYQAQLIAQKLSMAFHFHPAISTEKGKHGNAFFSKFPMKLIKNGNLPKLSQRSFLEPRGALWIELEWHGLKVQIFNTHLSLSPTEGLLQVKALCGPEWMGAAAGLGPILFCGDLNALPHSKICKELEKMLKNTHSEFKDNRPLKTLPSFYPLGLVDHIFMGPGFRATHIQAPRTELEKIASDHLPLIADLQAEVVLVSSHSR